MITAVRIFAPLFFYARKPESVFPTTLKRPGKKATALCAFSFASLSTLSVFPPPLKRPRKKAIQVFYAVTVTSNVVICAKPSSPSLRGGEADAAIHVSDG
jgi:hypothetical protein